MGDPSAPVTWRPYVLSTPALLILAILLLGPLMLLGRVSCYEQTSGYGFYTPNTFTLTHYEKAFDGFGWRLIGTTVRFALAITATTLLIAYPLALFIWRLPRGWQQLALTAVFIQKLACALVLIFGLQQLLGERGPIRLTLTNLGVVDESWSMSRSTVAVVIGEVMFVLPYAIAIIYLQLLRINRDLLVAAQGLGASLWQTFRQVTWPLSRPGVILAGELTLIWALGAYLGPLFLGRPEDATLAVEIQRQAFEYSRWPRAASLGVVALATIATAYCCARLLAWFGRGRQ